MASTDKRNRSGRKGTPPPKKKAPQKKPLRAGRVQSDKWWMNHQLEIFIAVVVLLWIGLEFLT